jgi:phenylalanyl-tRNA synthetase beta chain
VAAAELLLERLDRGSGRPAAIERPSEFQAVERDLNLVMDEEVPWASVAEAIAAAAGACLERLTLGQIWTDAERLGAGRKSVLVTLRLRSHDETLTADRIRSIVEAVLSACAVRCGATLRGT